MKKNRKPFANMANVDNITISETSKLFLKCDAMLDDIFECLSSMEDSEEQKGYDFVRCISVALGQLSDAQCAIEDLYQDYSHEIQLKTNYEFI